VYYIEYFERRAGVPLERFHEVALASFPEWSRRESEDELVASLGRTWRSGPDPYVLVWGCDSFARLDEWDRLFSSGEVDDIETPILDVMHTYSSGFYRDVVPSLPRPRGGRYGLETFRPWEGAGESYRARAEAAGLELNLVLERIGLLGPGPGGLALFSLPRLSAIERLAQSIPEQVNAVGLYADLGSEIL
jgi:hypothetical protein